MIYVVSVLLVLGNVALTLATLVFIWTSDKEFAHINASLFKGNIAGAVWTIVGIVLCFLPVFIETGA
ncbi:hypothetical protein [Sphingomonas lacusdianchii]|uniref:hypothetical protein n=1 Tax=Sphingomonas lacusdianchii TaxID=2917992 RepID=UPI001F574042|nr:hypothetical protein [Sphingomonas sp. JXJ CY 53]